MMIYMSTDADADGLGGGEGVSYDDDRLGSGPVVFRRRRLSLA